MLNLKHEIEKIYNNLEVAPSCDVLFLLNKYKKISNISIKRQVSDGFVELYLGYAQGI